MDRKSPPASSRGTLTEVVDDPSKKRRAPTYGDRNESRRWASPALGVPEIVEHEDLTGQYERDEIDVETLERGRARRQTPQRIALLEKKHDKLALTVAGMDGKVSTILDMTSKAETAREAREKREGEERASKRANIVPIITAAGIAIAAVVAALVGHYS